MKLNEFRVLVSIVNYKTSSLVCRMLPTLINQLDTDTDKVVIIDNDSQDNSFEVINDFVNSSGLSSMVKVVAAKQNGGFSYGNNLAIKTATDYYGVYPDFIWLLNPDTLLEEGALSTLISFMEQHPDVGITGSKLQSEDGTPQRSAFRFGGIANELLTSLSIGWLNNHFSHLLVYYESIPDTPTLCDWVAGASMLIRKEVIKSVGLMDENYFLYFEETDFCLQANRNDWQCWYIPDSKVTHYVGKSTGIVSGDTQRKRRPKYWFESRQYYFIKNYGYTYTALADLCWGIGFTILQLRYFIQRKRGNDPDFMLRDFWRNSIFLSWLRSE